MKRMGLGLTLLLLGAVASSLAWADHGHHRGHHHGGAGVYVGMPWPGYYYAYPPYYYQPYYTSTVIVTPSPPPVYIEKAPATETELPAPSYWYYCSNPQGYYPYIKECPAGWQKVAPRPPSSAQ